MSDAVFSIRAQPSIEAWMMDIEGPFWGFILTSDSSEATTCCPNVVKYICL
jgi:hypothetical protein